MRAQAIRNEVFSDKAEKLETDIVRISSGDVYKIIPRFGNKYEDSRIIKLDPEDVEYHVEEAKKLESLRKLWQARIKKQIKKQRNEDMVINNDIKALILEYTGRYFRFENDFYKLPDIKFTDANWQKFKNGDTSIERMGAARVNAMLNCLFDDFELAMIGKAQHEYYLDNSLKLNMPFYAYYDMFKNNNC